MYLTLRRYAGVAPQINQVSLKVKAGLVPIFKAGAWLPRVVHPRHRSW
jgi:hypothetical protein